MALHDFTETKFLITTTSTTGAFHDLAGFLTEFSGWDLEALTEEVQTMSANYVTEGYVGVKRLPEFTIGGFYDDVGSSGPAAILGNATDIGAERCIKINWGTTNAYGKVDVVVKRFSRKPSRNAFTKFEAAFVPCSSYAVVTT